MSSTEFNVRPAKPRDFADLKTLLQSYYLEGNVARSDSDEELRDLLAHPDPGFCVADYAGRLQACLLCRRLATVAGACECKRMFVAPPLRRRGVASRLMDFAENLAAKTGFGWMYLDSKDNFGAAIAMYRARGYRECERYNQNPEATLFLRKQLVPEQAHGGRCE